MRYLPPTLLLLLLMLLLVPEGSSPTHYTDTARGNEDQQEHDIIQRTCALEVVLTVRGVNVPEAFAKQVQPLPRGVVPETTLLACTPVPVR